MGRKLIGIVASVGGGEVSEAGGGWTGEERRIVHLSSTQRHPTPPNASPALVESPALPAGEAAAAGTKSILGLRDSAAACEPAPALWAPTWGWHLAPGTWPALWAQGGAGTEPKNRSRAHHSTDSRRMQNWCELLFSGSYSWKI